MVLDFLFLLFYFYFFGLSRREIIKTVFSLLNHHSIYLKLDGEKHVGNTEEVENASLEGCHGFTSHKGGD